MNNPRKQAAPAPGQEAVARLVREAELLESAEAQAAWLREHTDMARFGYREGGLDLEVPLYLLKGVRFGPVLVQMGGKIVQVAKRGGSAGPRAERELTDAEWMEVLSEPAVQERYGLQSDADPKAAFFKRHGAGKAAETAGTSGVRMEYRIVAPVDGVMRGLRLVRDAEELRVIAEMEQVLEDGVAEALKRMVA